MPERLQNIEHQLPKLERKDLDRVEPVVIPGREIPGVKFVLKKGNHEPSRAYVNSKIFNDFKFIIVENVSLQSWEQGTKEYKLGSKPNFQTLHHDAADLMDKDQTVGLYHPAQEYGKTKRQATTLFADSKNYWPKAIQLLKDWDPGHTETMPIVWKYIHDIKQGSEDDARQALQLEFKSKPFLSEKLREWGMDPNSGDGLLVHLLDSRLAKDDEELARGIYSNLKSEILEVEWHPNMLVMFDNVEFVHGLGPIPKGGKPHIAGSELETHLVPTTMNNLSEL